METVTRPQHPSSFIIRFLRLLRGILFWTSVVISTIFCSICVLTLLPLTIIFDRRRNFLHHFGYIWFRLLEIFNPWWKFEIEGRENLAPLGEAVVYVSNHQSQVDIVALFAMNTNFRFIAKASLFQIPIFGWAMKALGTVPIRRGDKDSAAKCLEEAAEKIKMGVPVTLFAEGTRSRDGIVGSFKTGAFRLAKDCDVKVIPICLQGCDKLLPKGSLIPQSAKVSVTIFPAIDTKDLSLSELIHATREKIVSILPPEQRGSQKPIL